MPPPPRPHAGPYEEALILLIGEAAATAHSDDKSTLALACPPWLLDRIAEETGHAAITRPRGDRLITLGSLSVLGSFQLDDPAGGAIIVFNQISGWWTTRPVRCHPALPPSRWRHLTLALDYGLNPAAAVALAGISA